MKKSMFLIALMLVGVCTPAGAQGSDDGGDDMYFTPAAASKKAKKSSKAQARQPLTVRSGSDDAEGETLDYNSRDYSDAEVDAYNRRGRGRGVAVNTASISGDTLYIGDGDEAGRYSDRYADAYSEGYNPNDYYYSSRLARFHEPAVDIYLGYGIYPYSWSWSFGWGNPYWWNSYYGWYDPWGWPGYYGWYSWGWGNPWHYGWAYWDRPWAPRGPRHISAWNGGRYVAGHSDYSRWGSAGGRIWGGGRNYRGAIERGGSRSAALPGAATRGRNSYNAGRNPSSGNMRTRTFGGSRIYGNSSTSSSSTRSVGGSAPSRSFGGGSSSPSMSTRSFGGGGGRSFGGGGGRSFGGGRR